MAENNGRAYLYGVTCDLLVPGMGINQSVWR